MSAAQRDLEMRMGLALAKTKTMDELVALAKVANDPRPYRIMKHAFGFKRELGGGKVYVVSRGG